MFIIVKHTFKSTRYQRNKNLQKKIYIKYFIKYSKFNIDKIWNTNKSKIIKTKNVIFNKNSSYDSTNINLN